MSDFLVKTSGLDLDENIASSNSVKTLVLLHGWGMNSRVWETVREPLEARYHIIWIDLPGHGFNRQLKAESLEYMVTTISEFMPVNTHIMAWSLGGMIAQALAQKIPDKINSLTLVTSTPRFSQDENWQHAMSDEVLNRFADNLKQDTVKTLKGFIALQFIGVTDSKVAQDNLIKHILKDGKTLKKGGGVFLNNESNTNSDYVDYSDNQKENDSMLNIPSQEALDVGLEILKHADLRSNKPTCPEHWIFAEYDRLIPKEVINDLILLRPDAEITLLEKAGHAPFITHSEIFLKQVTDFIDDQPFVNNHKNQN